MLKKAARPQGAWDSAMGEVGAFFKPAGVLGKNVADFVTHPLDNLPFVGKGNTEGAKEFLRALRATRNVDSEVRQESPILQGEDMRDRREWGQAAMPSLDPVARAWNGAEDLEKRALESPFVRYNPALRAPVEMARAVRHPIDTWNSVFNGTNPGDGDLNAVLGTRGQEQWQGLQEDVARVESMDRQAPFVTRAARAILPDSASQYFDPQSEDIMSAASDAGFSAMDSLGIAMTNPLEWLGAESGAGLADKLSNAGRARKALNAVGRVMDPTQLALDGAGKVASKAIDWTIPSKRAAKTSNGIMTPEEIARRSGVDPAEVRAYVNERAAMDAAPATDTLWDDLMGEPIGNETRSLIDGLVDEATPGYYDRIARNIPDDYAAPVARAEDMTPVADMADEAFVAPNVPSSSLDGLWDESIPAVREATIPAQEDAFLLDQASQAADEFDAMQQFQREQSIRSTAKEAQLGQRLNDLTPSILPESNVDDALRWLDAETPRMDGSLEDALRAELPAAANPSYAKPADPLLSLGEPSPAALDAALATPKRWSDLLLNEGDRAAQARQIAPSLPVPKTEMDSLLAPHTPNALPATFVDDALKWLGHFDDGGARLGQEATQDLGRIGTRGDVALEAGPGMPGAVAQSVPPSSAVGMVDNVTASPVGPGAQRTGTLQGGLKLYSSPFDPTVLWDAGVAANKAVSEFMGRVEGKVNQALGRAVDNSKMLTEAKASLKRVFSENYGKASVELGDRITEHQMQGNAVRRLATETIYETLNVGTETERKAMMGYMNGSLKRADAAQVLNDGFLQAADAVRYLMDDAGARYIATSLDIDADFLRQASTAEKTLVKELYESFNKPQARSKVLAGAAARNSPQFIQKAQNLIDGAMQRMTKQGFVKDGRIVDMGLDMGTWIANLGKYEPRLYKAIEYGVDLSSPTAAMDFVNAIEARHSTTADLMNELRAAQGLPPVKAQPLSDDIKQFILANYTGSSGWNSAVAQEAGRFMKRKDLSQELRDILGPMVNPAYTYTKGVQHVHLMENLMKMRRWAASNENLVSRAGETVEAFMARTKIQPTEIAYDFATNPQYASQAGALQGRFIHRDVADMMAATGVVPHLTGPDALDTVKRLSRTWLALSKVIYNPASHARQFLQNGFSVYTNVGVRGVADMVGGIKDIRQKSQAYLEARQAGLFSAGHDESFWAKVDLDSMPEFSWDGTEHALAKLARNVEWLSATASTMQKGYGAIKNAANAANNFAAKSFAAGDDLAKLAVFKHYRRQGYAPLEAARKASQEVYTGTGRSRYERLQSGLGVRDTYLDRGERTGYKALMADVAGGLVQQTFFGATRFLYDQAYRGLAGVRGGHWMPLTDPARAARTYGVMVGIMGLGELGRYAGGVSPEEESANKPDYMRTLLPSSALLAPQLSQLISGDGHSDWVDFSPLVPYGVASQGSFNVRQGRMSNMADNLASTFIPGIGVTSKLTGAGSGSPINPMLKPLVELWQNEDSFSGRRIYPEQMGNAAKVRPVLAHAWRSYLPPWAPNPAGLFQAFSERVERDDPQKWESMAREAMQGVATDSGHLASKAISGALNSIDYWTLGEKVAESRRILDYRGRDQYMGKVFADMLGIRIESRMAGEIARNRNNTKKAIMGEKNKEYKEAIRNARGPERTRLTQEFQREKQALLSAQPSLRWYENPRDTLENALNALHSLWPKLSDAERRKLVRQEA